MFHETAGDGVFGGGVVAQGHVTEQEAGGVVDGHRHQR